MNLALKTTCKEYKMGKLFFYYSTMNAGKSTNLLQASYNYQERGFKTLLFTFNKDNRGYGKSIGLSVSSRIGVSEHAIGFDEKFDFKRIFLDLQKIKDRILTLEEVLNIKREELLLSSLLFGKEIEENELEEKIKEYKNILFELLEKIDNLGALFVDEAQFLTEKQVKDLAWIVDELGFPVLCYGLRTDFLGNVFEGAKWLLGWADELVEMKTICPTGKKATFVLRLDDNQIPLTEGSQILIGGNSTYLPVSRKIHRRSLTSKKIEI